MSANLPIAAVLDDLTRQIGHWQRQQELHTEQAEHHGRQQLFHQERREEAAAELEVLRARHEAFRAAAEAAGEVVGRPTGDAAPAAAAVADEPDLPRVRRTGRVVLIRLLAEVIQGKPPDESFTHASLAREVQAVSATACASGWTPARSRRACAASPRGGAWKPCGRAPPTSRRSTGAGGRIGQIWSCTSAGGPRRPYGQLQNPPSQVQVKLLPRMEQVVVALVQGSPCRTPVRAVGILLHEVRARSA